MRVNGIDARTFKAKQLTVDVQPPSTAVKYDWNDGDLKPNAYKTEEKAGTLKLVMYFVAKDRTEVIRNISKFLAHLNDVAVLDLDGYAGSYHGIKKDAKIVKTLELHKRKLEIDFDGYFEDGLIVKELKKAVQTYETQGSRDAPCTVKIKNGTEESQTVKVEGLTDTGNIIATVPAGKTIVIDGDTGLVTIDGENAFASMEELWEFPKMKQGVVEIRRNEDLPRDVAITVEYRPMWLV